MATTITLTKVEPVLAGDQSFLPGTDNQLQGKIYKYEFVDNSTPAKVGVLLFPTADLLTTGGNTGTIVITDTPS